MADRITRAQVRSVFELLVQKLGKRIAKNYNDVGGWRLDYNIGGMNVEEIVSKSGGVSNPLGMRRRSPREMFEAIHFALDVVRVARVGILADVIADEVATEPRQRIARGVKDVQEGLSELIRTEPDGDLRAKQKEAARLLAGVPVLLNGGHGPATES